eukprot:jgi/Mesvir1/22829/Mv20091-RA.1
MNLDYGIQAWRPFGGLSAESAVTKSSSRSHGYSSQAYSSSQRQDAGDVTSCRSSNGDRAGSLSGVENALSRASRARLSRQSQPAMEDIRYSRAFHASMRRRHACRCGWEGPERSGHRPPRQRPDSSGISHAPFPGDAPALRAEDKGGMAGPCRSLPHSSSSAGGGGGSASTDHSSDASMSGSQRKNGVNAGRSQEELLSRMRSVQDAAGPDRRSWDATLRPDSPGNERDTHGLGPPGQPATTRNSQTSGTRNEARFLGAHTGKLNGTGGGGSSSGRSSDGGSSTGPRNASWGSGSSDGGSTGINDRAAPASSKFPRPHGSKRGAAASSRGAAYISNGAAASSTGAAYISNDAAASSTGATYISNGAAASSVGAAYISNGAAASSVGAVYTSNGAADSSMGAAPVLGYHASAPPTTANGSVATTNGFATAGEGAVPSRASHEGVVDSGDVPSYHVAPLPAEDGIAAGEIWHDRSGSTVDLASPQVANDGTPAGSFGANTVVSAEGGNDDAKGPIPFQNGSSSDGGRGPAALPASDTFSESNQAQGIGSGSGGRPTEKQVSGSGVIAPLEQVSDTIPNCGGSWQAPVSPPGVPSFDEYVACYFALDGRLSRLPESLIRDLALLYLCRFDTAIDRRHMLWLLQHLACRMSRDVGRWAGVDDFGGMDMSDEGVGVGGEGEMNPLRRQHYITVQIMDTLVWHLERLHHMYFERWDDVDALLASNRPRVSALRKKYGAPKPRKDASKEASKATSRDMGKGMNRDMNRGAEAKGDMIKDKEGGRGGDGEKNKLGAAAAVAAALGGNHNDASTSNSNDGSDEERNGERGPSAVGGNAGSMAWSGNEPSQLLPSLLQPGQPGGVEAELLQADGQGDGQGQSQGQGPIGSMPSQSSSSSSSSSSLSLSPSQQTWEAGTGAREGEASEAGSDAAAASRSQGDGLQGSPFLSPADVLAEDGATSAFIHAGTGKRSRSLAEPDQGRQSSTAQAEGIDAGMQQRSTGADAQLSTGAGAQLATGAGVQLPSLSSVTVAPAIGPMLASLAPSSGHLDASISLVPASPSSTTLEVGLSLAGEDEDGAPAADSKHPGLTSLEAQAPAQGPGGVASIMHGDPTVLGSSAVRDGAAEFAREDSVGASGVFGVDAARRHEDAAMESFPKEAPGRAPWQELLASSTTLALGGLMSSRITGARKIRPEGGGEGGEGTGDVMRRRQLDDYDADCVVVLPIRWDGGSLLLPPDDADEWGRMDNEYSSTEAAEPGLASMFANAATTASGEGGGQARGGVGAEFALGSASASSMVAGNSPASFGRPVPSNPTTPASTSGPTVAASPPGAAAGGDVVSGGDGAENGALAVAPLGPPGGLSRTAIVSSNNSTSSSGGGGGRSGPRRQRGGPSKDGRSGARTAEVGALRSKDMRLGTISEKGSEWARVWRDLSRSPVVELSVDTFLSLALSPPAPLEDPGPPTGGVVKKGFWPALPTVESRGKRGVEARGRGTPSESPSEVREGEGRPVDGREAAGERGGSRGMLLGGGAPSSADGSLAADASSSSDSDDDDHSSEHVDECPSRGHVSSGPGRESSPVGEDAPSSPSRHRHRRKSHREKHGPREGLSVVGASGVGNAQGGPQGFGGWSVDPASHPTPPSAPSLPALGSAASVVASSSDSPSGSASHPALPATAGVPAISSVSPVSFSANFAASSATHLDTGPDSAALLVMWASRGCQVCTELEPTLQRLALVFARGDVAMAEDGGGPRGNEGAAVQVKEGGKVGDVDKGEEDVCASCGDMYAGSGEADGAAGADSGAAEGSGLEGSSSEGSSSEGSSSEGSAVVTEGFTAGSASKVIQGVTDNSSCDDNYNDVHENDSDRRGRGAVKADQGDGTITSAIGRMNRAGGGREILGSDPRGHGSSSDVSSDSNNSDSNSTSSDTDGGDSSPGGRASRDPAPLPPLPRVIVGRLHGSELPAQFCRRQGVRAYPTLQLYWHGRLLAQYPHAGGSSGAYQEASLLRFVHDALTHAQAESAHGWAATRPSSAPSMSSNSLASSVAPSSSPWSTSSSASHPPHAFDSPSSYSSLFNLFSRPSESASSTGASSSTPLGTPQGGPRSTQDEPFPEPQTGPGEASHEVEDETDAPRMGILASRPAYPLRAYDEDEPPLEAEAVPSSSLYATQAFSHANRAGSARDAANPGGVLPPHPGASGRTSPAPGMNSPAGESDADDWPLSSFDGAVPGESFQRAVMSGNNKAGRPGSDGGTGKTGRKGANDVLAWERELYAVGGLAGADDGSGGPPPAGHFMNISDSLGVEPTAVTGPRTGSRVPGGSAPLDASVAGSSNGRSVVDGDGGGGGGDGVTGSSSRNENGVAAGMPGSGVMVGGVPGGGVLSEPSVLRRAKYFPSAAVLFGPVANSVWEEAEREAIIAVGDGAGPHLRKPPRELPPTIIFLGGGMGAGKSTVANAIAGTPFWEQYGDHAVVIDPDALKLQYVTKLKGTGGMGAAGSGKAGEENGAEDGDPPNLVGPEVHQASLVAAQELLVVAVNHGRDIVLDGTMSWAPYIEQTVAMLKDTKHLYKRGPGVVTSPEGVSTEVYWEIDEAATAAARQVRRAHYPKSSARHRTEDPTPDLRRAYLVEMVAVTVDAGEAVERAIVRQLVTGRGVPVRQLLASHRQFSANFANYARIFDGVVLFENATQEREADPMARGSALEHLQGAQQAILVAVKSAGPGSISAALAEAAGVVTPPGSAACHSDDNVGTCDLPFPLMPYVRDSLVGGSDGKARQVASNLLIINRKAMRQFFHKKGINPDAMSRGALYSI